MPNNRQHWEMIYQNRPITELGWYEPLPQKSLELLAMCQLSATDLILDVGAGTSSLADALLGMGFQRIAAIDISAAALEALRQRTGDNPRVTYLHGDITDPHALDGLNGVRLWHDRAMLHFLVELTERQAYLAALRQVLLPGGYAILAAFHLRGAKVCSGLPVMNYDENGLAEFLGSDFELLHSAEHTYHQPSGDPRLYIYTLFRRKE